MKNTITFTQPSNQPVTKYTIKNYGKLIDVAKVNLKVNINGLVYRVQDVLKNNVKLKRVDPGMFGDIERYIETAYMPKDAWCGVYAIQTV